MGIVAGYEQALESARRHRDERKHDGKGKDRGPRPDAKTEAIAAALDGAVRVHFHCYRSEDMAVVLDVAREYGLPITAFHHASEAYKIPDLLVRNKVCGVVFSNWWGFKMENYDAIRENAAFLEAAGACVALHSDSSVTGQRLNLEAAKAMAAGQQAGIDIPREVAIRWITSNAAKIIGLDDQVGTLEPGKNADVVVWSGDPFSVYTRADLVFIDGALRYDRSDPAMQPVPDFSLGQPAREERP
jgi:imidazolonepropionase-like amidohydrolase